MSFQAYSEDKARLFNQYLDRSLNRFRDSVSLRFAPLIESMEYSLAGGGKRFRPLLVFASAECVGLTPEAVLPAACALEYIHTYSLVHDDLPAMDDDDERRGRPSSHKKYGEAVAILTGDALLTEAFSEILQLSKSNDFKPSDVLAAVEQLSHYSGARGMVGGQLLDVTTELDSYSLPELEFIHIHKTGALIVASVLLPTKLVDLDSERSTCFRRYAEALGLAFQISDDLIDSANTRHLLERKQKQAPMYAALMSPREMREKLDGLVDAAVKAIEPEGDRAGRLVEIAEFVRARKE